MLRMRCHNENKPMKPSMKVESTREQILVFYMVLLMMMAIMAHPLGAATTTTAAPPTQPRFQSENQEPKGMVEPTTVKKAVTKTVASSAFDSTLTKTLERYHRAQNVSSTLTKEMTFPLLGKTQMSQGKLYFSKGKLRMEIQGADKMTLVLDGQKLWIERRFSRELGGQVQVMQMALHSEEKSLQSLLPLILGQKSFLEDFDIARKNIVKKNIAEKHLKHKGQKGQQVFDLRPKAGKKYQNLVRMEITIEREELKELIYWDELENKVHYKFGGPQFNTKISQKYFSYLPPKGAKVINHKLQR